jgi:hypothetical protein
VAITEEARHRMYEALIRELGQDEASTLMEHLPPVGWADVATRRDLEHQSLLLKKDLEHLESKIEATLHREMSALKSWVVGVMIASQAAFGAIVIAAVRLI